MVAQFFAAIHQRRWHDAYYMLRAWYNSIAIEMEIDWKTGNVKGINFIGQPFTLTPVDTDDLLTTALVLSIDGGEPHVRPVVNSLRVRS